MKTIQLFAFALIISLSIFTKSSEVQKLTYASWNKPDVELFYKLPKEINSDTKVLFLIHGGSRDAEKYLSYWIDLAENKNVILIAPLFTKKNFPYYQTLGMATFSGKVINDESQWLDNSITNFFIFFKNKYSLKSDNYLMFGFSGGSQFIHRYLMYGNDKAIERAAIGSAGWYTFINGERFPYGIKNMPIEPGRIEWLLSQEILFLLGSKDNNPNDSSLNKSRGAKKQGKHRLERGNAYFKNLIAVGDRFNVPFRWRYKLVAGSDHSTKDMSQTAASFILRDLDYKE